MQLVTVISVLVPRIAVLEHVLMEAGVLTAEELDRARQALGAQYAIEAALEANPAAQALWQRMATTVTRPAPPPAE